KADPEMVTSFLSSNSRTEASASSSVTVGSNERRIASATSGTVLAEAHACHAAAAVAFSASTVLFSEFRIIREPSGIEFMARLPQFTRSTIMGTSPLSSGICVESAATTRAEYLSCREEQQAFLLIAQVPSNRR